MRRPTHAWLLVLYADEQHSKIARFWMQPSIASCAALLGETSQTVSNWYHGLIRGRNSLKYCKLARIKLCEPKRAGRRQPRAPASRAKHSGGGLRPGGGGVSSSCSHNAFGGAW